MCIRDSPRIIQEDPTCEGWSQDNQREIEKGWIKMAYTIADLGKQLGYNPVSYTHLQAHGSGSRL